MSAREKRLTVLALAAVGAAFYILNVLTPLYADDYSYLYTFIYTDHKFRITNLTQLFYSQLNHYMVMNGRTVAHTLAQLYLMWGKGAFNAVNTAAFLLLGWAMQALMTGKKGFHLPLFLFSAAMLWFFTPAFGQDFLWLTASCTYLHCLLLTLLFLVPFRRACGGDSRGGALRAALFFPFGVLAGWSSENAALAMLVMAVCFLIVLRLERRPMHAWMFTGLAGALTGFALLMLAPGQSVRMTNSGGSGGVLAWVRRGVQITLRAGAYLWFPALMFLALVVWRLLRDRRSGVKTDWRRWLPTAVFLLGSLASAYGMVVSPQFPERTWGVVLVFTAVTAGSAAQLCPDLRPSRRVSRAACCLVLAAAALTYGQAYLSISKTHADVAQRTAYIEALLARGETEATVEPIRADSRYNCYSPAGDLGPDSTQWPNAAIARYYGLEALHSTQEEGGDAANG